jgi:glycosyltransferase involved in cell wall biosynthesis
MRVTALIERPEHVCARYRIEAFRSDLLERGLALELTPVGKRLWGRIRAFWRASRADIVIVQRKLLPVWQVCLLRRAARRLVYDFDDAIYQRDTFTRKRPESWKRELRFWATIYAADTVIAGNDFLAERATAYGDSQRIHRVPTCVDPRPYPLATQSRSGPHARLVWIGQRSTLGGLLHARQHWLCLGARLPGMELRLICDTRCTLPGVRVMLRRWSRATEKAELADGDIGVSWLPDDAWSRGKCGLKVLQYMAAGLPVVANPVGCHLEMVLPGRTGFLASTPRQWADAISCLAADPPLRRKMGEAGRRLVHERYSTQRWGPRFAELVAGVATSASRAEQPGRHTPQLFLSVGAAPRKPVAAA